MTTVSTGATDAPAIATGPRRLLHEMFDELRSRGAVLDYDIFARIGSGNAAMLGYDRAFVALTHATVRELMAEDGRFSNAVYNKMSAGVLEDTLLSMDAPRHPRYRALVASAFRPRIAAQWAESYIPSVISGVLDDLAERESADFAALFAEHVPVFVIAKVLGLPRADWDNFQQWSIDFVSGQSDPERARGADRILGEYFGGLIEDRRRSSEEDFVSALLAAEIDGQRLTDAEVVNFMKQLLTAGAETTVHAMGSMFWQMVRVPETYAAVVADPGLATAAFEETLRWETPVTLLSREAAQDTELGGLEIPAGSLVIAAAAAANHDPQRWSHPHDYDLHRPVQQTMTFGAGPHLCIGMHLARNELRLGIAMTAERFPSLRVQDGVDLDAIPFGATLRGPASLPVTLR